MESESSRRLIRRRIAIFASLTLFALVCVGVVLWMTGTQARASIGGPFALTDQRGKPVTDADYRGKLMLVYFGYTYCPDVCPTTLSTIANALNALKPAERAQVAPMFITVDPERDTAQTMADYVTNFAPDLVGLTGTPDQIAKVEREYHVYAAKVPAADGSYSMDHSSIIYLMGKDGRFRAIVDAGAPAGKIDEAIRANL